MCAPYMKPALKNLYNLLFMVQGDLNIDVQELLLIFLDEIRFYGLMILFLKCFYRFKIF